MPNVLSKFFAGQLGLSLCHAECHELSHTWNPNCFLAIWDALGPSLVFCAKTYGSLYLLKSLVDKGGRVDKIEWRNLAAKTIRSSVFLTSTEILFMFWLCIFRRLLGFATWPTISFLNGFAACIISIWIESPHRRAMLVPYLLNLASEAAYRQARARNLCRPLPFGESFLFGLSIGLIVFLIKNSKKFSQSNSQFSSSTNFLCSILRQSHAIEPKELENSTRQQKMGEWKMDVGRASKIALKNVAISYSVLLMGKIIKKLFSRKKSPPSSIWPSFRLPFFLGTMPFLTQIFSSIFALKCKSNVANDGPHPSIPPSPFPFSSISAGLASTLAMASFWPNNTLALYAFWKMVELFYFYLVSARILPILPGGSVWAFCLVSSYLLSLAVLEPQALRPSYYKFLCSLTGNRLQLFNRALFDKYFGTNSCGLPSNNFGGIQKLLPPHLLTINPAQYSHLMHF